jgi:hypothetical protein
MTATTTKLLRRSLPALIALAVSLGAMATAATAAPGVFAFQPGSFVNAHPPVRHEPPFICFGLFQCSFDLGIAPSVWVEELEDTPEETQAGGHPDITSHFRFAKNGAPGEGEYRSLIHPHTVITDAPAGAVGNPLAVPRCEIAQFHLTITGACPPAAQVGGTITAVSAQGFEDLNYYSPVSSLVPSPGQSALLGFKAAAYSLVVESTVRSESDYGLRVNAEDIPLAAGDYVGSTFTLWGVPYDPVHDALRFNESGSLGGHIEGVPRPFLSAPTNCSSGPIKTTVKARPWEHLDQEIETSSVVSEPTGCSQVPFDPSATARPTTNVADSPTGLEVDISTPQHEGCEVIPALEGKLDEFLERGGALQAEIRQKRLKIVILEFGGGSAEEIEQAREELLEVREELEELGGESFYDCGIATSHLKDTTLTFPEGLTINPSGANGLDGCSPEEMGLTTPLGVTPQQFTKAVPTCPESSRIGSVEIDTPLLDAPMPGSVFIADPYDNPFKSLLAIYIVANDEERGVIVKLAGEVKADPITGQLSARVTNAPQLPFSHFLLHFKQGPHATLRTPGCGSYESTGELTPYSAPDSPVPVTDTWSISQGPTGSCELPNAPTLDAGTVSPSANSYSPFVMHLRRADGTQGFKSVTVSPPAGLLAKIAGVGRCSDAALTAAAQKTGKEEQASPSCPSSSRLGEVVAGAGAGPSPYYAHGNAYLSGPYKGAPLSMAIITPATAGPFDLGTIVVRVALRVDPVTARITAVSDEIPQILQGIPLDIRTVDVSLDRGQFTKTGTSCDPASVDGQLTSSFGQVASIQSRFQLAECTSLGFKPKLALSLQGGTTRGKHPALTAILTPRPGDANLAAISVALPKSEFLDQGHIGTVCTRVQFAADQCPAASIYGKATVTTPLFDSALTGNVYLRSSNNELPDLVPDLRGPADTPIKVEAAGRTDSVNGGIRNTFEAIPDAPFTKLVMELKGGKKGLLQNSRNICANAFRATVKYTAQNGKLREGHPALRPDGCAKAHKRKGKGAKKHSAR